MKYIKKDEYKNTKHELRDENGSLVIISNDIMSNDYIYSKNKFMFDVLNEDEKENIDNISKTDENNETEVVIEELAECKTLKQIYELAEENDLDLDGRIKNIAKLKDNFKEELKDKE